MKKSKIEKLLKSKDAVLIFDVDGVLAAYEFGKRNHNACNDEDWQKLFEESSVYENIRPIKTIKKWLKKYGNPDRTFVCTKSYTDAETEDKVKFVTKNYPIKTENVFAVKTDDEKLEVLKKIHNDIFPDTKEKYIIMIDDTINVLSNIQENSNYSTAHISSFMI